LWGEDPFGNHDLCS